MVRPETNMAAAAKILLDMKVTIGRVLPWRDVTMLQKVVVAMMPQVADLICRSVGFLWWTKLAGCWGSLLAGMSSRQRLRLARLRRACELCPLTSAVAPDSAAGSIQLCLQHILEGDWVLRALGVVGTRQRRHILMWLCVVYVRQLLRLARVLEIGRGVFGDCTRI